MKDCQPDGIKRHFEELGLKRGDNVLVHSRLFSFGRIVGSSPCQTLYDSLIDYLGPDSTIAVPTHLLGESEPYDPQKTPSHESGVFSEYVRQLPNAFRSLCPIHNHASVGPNARCLEDSDPTISFGQGSDFSTFYNNKFTLVLLGCSFTHGGTYLHHLEALMDAPYRHWIELHRLLVPRGKVEPSPIVVRYFARKDRAYHEDFDKIIPVLRKSGALREAELSYGKSFAIPLDELHKTTVEMVALDPYFLVKKVVDESVV